MDACSLNVTETTSSHTQKASTLEHAANFDLKQEKNHELYVYNIFSPLFRFFFTIYNFLLRSRNSFWILRSGVPTVLPLLATGHRLYTGFAVPYDRGLSGLPCLKSF